MPEKLRPIDFSIVIVTYNRPNEIRRNFSHLVKLKSMPREVIVVDQSELPDTRKVCSQYSKKIPGLKYVHADRPSIPAAKNLGVKKSSTKSKVIIFLDDDAYLGPSYMDQMAHYYNILPNCNGVFGWDYHKFGGERLDSFSSKVKFFIGKAVRRAFLLGHVGAKFFSVTSPYGANSTLPIDGAIGAQWFPGTDPSYRKSILDKMKFDENFFWYSLGEDVDISYRIWRRYGGLYVVPADITHIHPPKEDDETRKIRKIYMNQINHFYLFYKIMPQMRLRFAWNLFGISILRTFSLLQLNKFSKRYVEWKFFAKSLFYSIANRKRIARGDLSIPYPKK